VIELGLHSGELMVRGIEGADQLVAFGRKTVAVFGESLLGLAALRFEIVSAAALMCELLFDARTFDRLRLEPGAVRGAFFLEPRALGGVLVEAGAIRGGFLGQARPFSRVFVGERAQLLFGTGPLAGKLLFGTGPLVGELLFGASPLLGEGAFELLAAGRRMLGRRLFGFDPQAHGFSDHPPFGVGPHRGDLGLEARRPLAANLLDLRRPSLFGVGLGGAARLLDLVGVALGQPCQLSFELLVQAAPYRVDRRTKRIFSHFSHYRGA
jgi:hypothetical protein